MKSCKSCKYSLRNRDLSSEFRWCKYHNEKKKKESICDQYKKKSVGSALYDYIIFVLNLV
ncbi:MAG: hypothetical protein ACFFAN_07560 [Promethearchaeota archaeon]